MTKDDSLILRIRLTPKASRNGLTGWVQDADGNPVLKAAVTAAPEKGRANKALIELLSEAWDVSKSRLEIVRGDTDRNKTVRIANPTEKERDRILGNILK